MFEFKSIINFDQVMIKLKCKTRLLRFSIWHLTIRLHHIQIMFFLWVFILMYTCYIKLPVLQQKEKRLSIWKDVMAENHAYAWTWMSTWPLKTRALVTRAKRKKLIKITENIKVTVVLYGMISKINLEITLYRNTISYKYLRYIHTSYNVLNGNWITTWDE